MSNLERWTWPKYQPYQPQCTKGEKWAFLQALVKKTLVHLKTKTSMRDLGILSAYTSCTHVHAIGRNWPERHPVRHGARVKRLNSLSKWLFLVILVIFRSSKCSGRYAGSNFSKSSRIRVSGYIPGLEPRDLAPRPPFNSKKCPNWTFLWKVGSNALEKSTYISLES